MDKPDFKSQSKYLNPAIAEEVNRDKREDSENKFTRHMGETRASGKQWVHIIGLVNEKQQLEIKPHSN